MARHRNVRTLDLNEEYEGYYSCYGHSVEDDLCISPGTEEEFLYKRNSRKQCMSSFLNNQLADTHLPEDRNNEADSRTSLSEKMSDIDIAQLRSCVEEIQNVVGDTIPESMLIEVAKAYKFDIERSLDAVLSGNLNYEAEKWNSQEVSNGRCGNNPEKSIKSSNKEQISHKDIPEKMSGKHPGVNPSASHFKELCISNQASSSGPDADEKEDEKGPDTESSLLYSKTNRLNEHVLHMYEKKRVDDKALLNLVVVGHVDAGKSTLMGHLLFRSGYVSKRVMHKYEQESKKLGKASFMYAWVLDETNEERNRGITMDVATSKLETVHRAINLLDAPGHKDFIPNMITGASQADVAILVVDATRGEFETGFETGGQTREHTLLVRSLGVSQLAVAVNKMDNVNWEQERYNEITKKLSAFLKQAGFKENDIQFIPCSGLTGENLTEAPEAPALKKWYNGPTLIDIIDKFKPPERLLSKPFRMCISDIFKGQSGGFCVAGQMESGYVCSGDKVSIMPAAEHGILKGILIDDSLMQECFAGDNVVFQLTGVDMSNVGNGSVICDINAPIKSCTRFKARLVLFNIIVPITKGFPVVVHYQSVCEQGIILKLLSQLHRSTGEVVKKHPRCLSKNSNAIVEIEVTRPICLELYKDFKNLGRFMLRSGGTTIAAGLVTKMY